MNLKQPKKNIPIIKLIEALEHHCKEITSGHILVDAAVKARGVPILSAVNGVYDESKPSIRSLSQNGEPEGPRRNLEPILQRADKLIANMIESAKAHARDGSPEALVSAIFHAGEFYGRALQQVDELGRGDSESLAIYDKVKNHCDSGLAFHKAITSVANQIGCSGKTIRNLVEKHEAWMTPHERIMKTRNRKGKK